MKVYSGYNTLYGLSIPFGSIIFFNSYMSSISEEVLLICRYFVFVNPIPCSALTLPWSLDTYSKIKGCNCDAISGSYDGIETCTWMFPSPNRPKINKIINYKYKLHKIIFKLFNFN